MQRRRKIGVTSLDAPNTTQLVIPPPPPPPSVNHDRISHESPSREASSTQSTRSSTSVEEADNQNSSEVEQHQPPTPIRLNNKQTLKRQARGSLGLYSKIKDRLRKHSDVRIPVRKLRRTTRSTTEDVVGLSSVQNDNDSNQSKQSSKIPLVVIHHDAKDPFEYDSNSSSPSPSTSSSRSTRLLQLLRQQRRKSVAIPPTLHEHAGSLNNSSKPSDTIHSAPEHRTSNGMVDLGQESTTVRFKDDPIELSSDDSRTTTPSRFRQFLVESFAGSRTRTKSENQPVTSSQNQQTSNSDSIDLPSHAYTITAGSRQANLLQSINNDNNGDIASQPHHHSVTGSLRKSLFRQLAGLSIYPGSGAGGGGGSSKSRTSSLAANGNNNRRKSPLTRFGQLVTLNSSGSRHSGRSADSLNLLLPDPSKMPKETPNASMEFTQTRLKDPHKISQKFQMKRGFDVRKLKRANSLSASGSVNSTDRSNVITAAGGGTSPLPRSYLLDQMSRSDEDVFTTTTTTDSSGRPQSVLLSVPNQTSMGPGSIVKSEPSPGRSSIKPVIYHNNHHHQLRGYHGHHHHRSSQHHRTHHHHGHHHHHSIRPAHTMTRVTESRRYLMFAKSLPLSTAKQYMEAQGTGTGDAETYAILFDHTPCYELMASSAKLVILDSRLTIAKAFKALMQNELRAAPVWTSATQSFSSMLTVTDFIQMLNLCWNNSDNNERSASDSADSRTNPLSTTLHLSDFDTMTIQQWKERAIKECASMARTRSLPSSTQPTIDNNCDADPSSSDAVADGGQPTSLPSSPSNDGTSPPTAIPPVAKPLIQPRLFAIEPEQPIVKGLRLLSRFRLHHLPVVESPYTLTGNILYVLTQRHLLNYLYQQIGNIPQPRFLQTLVNSGTYKTPEITIEEWLVQCKNYTKSGPQTIPPVEVCLRTNNLLYVIERLVKTKYRRLVIVSNRTDWQVVGIVSVSDVLRFAVSHQQSRSRTVLTAYDRSRSGRSSITTTEAVDELEEHSSSTSSNSSSRSSSSTRSMTSRSSSIDVGCSLKQTTPSFRERSNSSGAKVVTRDAGDALPS